MSKFKCPILRLFIRQTILNIVGEKGGKDGLKKDSRGDEDDAASIASYESSMVRKEFDLIFLIFALICSILC